jgi:CHAT domain-containing protein
VASLNLARMMPSGERLPALGLISAQLDAEPASVATAQFRINLAHQARLLGAPGRILATIELSKAGEFAHQAGATRLEAEVLTERALLEEESSKSVESLRDTRQALALIYSQPPPSVVDLKISLEHLQGRLLKASGDEAGALHSYGQAAEAIEAVREDIPIEDDDGRSTYATSIEPVTRGLVGLLVSRVDEMPVEQSQPLLKRAIETEEKMHQAEMQDFLGERCTVDTGQTQIESLIGKDTAVLYPLQFEDHIELLMRTPRGIAHRRVEASSGEVGAAVQRLAAKLRDGQGNYLPDARSLYRWLVAPMEVQLAEQNIKVLVVSPDSSLHMVPFAALNDGSQYLIERYAVANVTGLTMTNLAPAPQGDETSLVAGMSEPGPVVNKLAEVALRNGVLPSTKRGGAGSETGVISEMAREADVPKDREKGAENKERAVGDQARAVGDQERKVGELARLKAELTLPGVKEEVASLKTIVPGRQLIDADFTARNFITQAGSGDYSIVHVASHGFFGDSADKSFLLAYDDLLTMKQMQSLLTTEKVRTHPIDLLTLSACDTAEGNAKAPLGIAGVGIKAGAKSVVGALWPVDDETAHLFMARFYKGLAKDKVSKAQAMRQAQLELLKNPETAHPTFWGPFTLIGNWK